MPDIAFYRGVYLGEAIQESAFPALAGKAKAHLDWLCRRYKLKTDNQDSYKMAICAMAEVLRNHDRYCRHSAQTVGKVTLRYPENRQPLEEKLYRAASIYLDFYRGVC